MPISKISEYKFNDINIYPSKKYSTCFGLIYNIHNYCIARIAIPMVYQLHDIEDLYSFVLFENLKENKNCILSIIPARSMFVGKIIV